MRESKQAMRRYLLKEQGYDEDVVRSMSGKELVETYEHYHEGF